MAKIAARKKKEKKTADLKRQRKALEQQRIVLSKQMSKADRSWNKLTAQINTLTNRIERYEESNLSFGFHETHT